MSLHFISKIVTIHPNEGIELHRKTLQPRIVELSSFKIRCNYSFGTK